MLYICPLMKAVRCCEGLVIHSDNPLTYHYARYKKRSLTILYLGMIHQYPYTYIPIFIYMAYIYGVVAHPITGNSTVCWTLSSGWNRRNIKAIRTHYWYFLRGIYRWPADYPHKEPVLLKELPCHDVIKMSQLKVIAWWLCLCDIYPLSDIT